MSLPAAIVPSVLPADLARLGEVCRELERAGADRIQWDVMDGRFVPNLTFGPDVIASARAVVSVGFEAHLMVEEPERSLARYVDAGCELVIVHAEATTHLHRTLATIRELGVRAGVALNPATPLSAVDHVLELVSLLLIMTVDPGFSGQRYLSGMEPKISEARARIDRDGLPVALEVDGGIGPSSIARAAAAGADTFCAGSAVVCDPAGPVVAIERLRRLAERGRELPKSVGTERLAARGVATGGTGVAR